MKRQKRDPTLPTLNAKNIPLRIGFLEGMFISDINRKIQAEFQCSFLEADALLRVAISLNLIKRTQNGTYSINNQTDE